MKLFELLSSETEGEWFISGSYGLAVPSKQSDLDICVPIWRDPKSIHLRISKESKHPVSIKASDYFTGIYLNGVEFEELPEVSKINLIPLHPRDFLAWAMATRSLQQISLDFSSSLLTNPLKSKDVRVHQFEVMTAMYKALIDSQPEYMTKALYIHNEFFWHSLKTITKPDIIGVKNPDFPF